MHQFICILTVICSFLAPFTMTSAALAKEIFTKEIYLMAQIYEPTCKVNNGKTVSVDFGSNRLQDVNGGNIRKDVEFSIDCPGAEEQQNLSLTLDAIPAVWDLSKIQTSSPGLAISLNLKGSGVSIPVNQPQQVTWGNLKTWQLEAVLHSHPVIIPTEGAFNASATIWVRYQ